MNHHWSIVGNPDNRRVQFAQEAARKTGLAAPQVVSWLDLLSDSKRAMEKLVHSDMVRIDSAGEDLVVQNRLIELGGGKRSLVFAELDLHTQEYRGFAATLNKLAQISTCFQNCPVDIATMFDKWACHKLFRQAGLSRPVTVQVPIDEPLHAFVVSRFGAAGRIFLKPRYGSSATGVCAYIWSQNKRRLIAPIELTLVKQARQGSCKHRLFNSLKVRSYTSQPDIEVILKLLKPQQLICEAWVSKARVDGEYFDLRILVIQDEARHVVVRQSSSPMTNLHLGNRRGSLQAVTATVGQAQIDRALSMAVCAKELFTKSLYAGVDILIPVKGSPVVCEINAFGDLLPNVLDRGETTYHAVMNAALRKHAPGAVA